MVTYVCFFFQAEDGIRDLYVTGVQTCALPISAGEEPPPEEKERKDEYGLVTLKIAHLGRQMRDTQEVFAALKENLDQIMANLRSEERRVGKECRSRWCLCDESRMIVDSERG